MAKSLDTFRLSSDESDEGGQEERYIFYDERYKPLYSRLQFLGEGTYGAVFMARHLETKQKFVIKKMKRGRFDDLDGIEAIYLREISLLRHLKGHPRIVELHDVFFSHQKEVCLVFECCKMDLYQWFQSTRHGGIEVDRIRLWSYQIIDALCYIHSKRVLHRDIKPQNIFLVHDSENDGELSIKIGDFGLSREYDTDCEETDNAAIDYSSNVVTLWYKAPELLMGATAYDSTLDVWSAGIVITQMARFGHILFDGHCEWEVMLNVFQILGTPQENEWCSELPFWSKKLPDFKPKSLAPNLGKLKDDHKACDLIEQMLAMNPKKRSKASKLLQHPWFEPLKKSKVKREAQSAEKKEDIRIDCNETKTTASETDTDNIVTTPTHQCKKFEVSPTY